MKDDSHKPRVARIEVTLSDGYRFDVDPEEFDLLFWRESALEVIRPFYEQDVDGRQTMADIRSLCAGQGGCCGHSTGGCLIVHLPRA